MLKQATKIKTLIGLSALSLSIAYLLTDKLIELGIIKTNFGVGMLFVFLFVFVVSNLLLVIISKRKQSAKTNSLKQTVKSGKGNIQKMKASKNAVKNVKADQTVSSGDKNDQQIDIS